MRWADVMADPTLRDLPCRHGVETPFSEAPEICVEIISPSNAKGEMDEKMKLYFAKGAKEVWLISERGAVTFYNPKGAMDRSDYGVRLDLALDGIY